MLQSDLRPVPTTTTEYYQRVFVDSSREYGRNVLFDYLAGSEAFWSCMLSGTVRLLMTI